MLADEISTATLIEVSFLVLGTALLLWSSFAGKRWGRTVSALFWSLRNRLGPRGRLALFSALAAGLGYLWWHLAFGGG